MTNRRNKAEISITHCDVAGIDVVIGSWVWLSAKHHSRVVVWQTQRERYSKSTFKVTVLDHLRMMFDRH